MGQSPLVKGFEGKTVGKGFGFALSRLLEGKKVRRLEWENLDAYLAIKDDILMVHRADDKLLHPLMVSVGDMRGKDWVVVIEKGTLH